MSTKESLYHSVSTHYSHVATNSPPTSEKSTKIANAFGYSPDDLSQVPEGANLGLSCGNPLAVAGVRKGETVVDLGCGTGFDVFLAAGKVGVKGWAIGVDMNKDMLARACLNAEKSSATNVKFVESNITSIDLPSSCTECIISNCVINLVPAPDKHLVFKEMFRLLKPCGRVAISDILAKKEFPLELQVSIALYVGCISGASSIGEYEKWLRDAGFKDIMIVDKKSDLNVYKDDSWNEDMNEKITASICCESDEKKPSASSKESDHSCCDNGQSPTNTKLGTVSCCGTTILPKEDKSADFIDIDFNEWVGSFSIFAVKP